VLLNWKKEMKRSILFVCWGNICRSPSAEAVFKSVIEKAGIIDDFEVDSAGTIAAHQGERADQRMRTYAAKRGYRLDSISRKVDPDIDFDRFDYIITMDDNNLNDMIDMARSESDIQKISKMTDYSMKFDSSSVPDPYYGGTDGFELVLDLLEDACEGLLLHVKRGE
jgi:protein-tyrosine phosphatase